MIDEALMSRQKENNSSPHLISSAGQALPWTLEHGFLVRIARRRFEGQRGGDNVPTVQNGLFDQIREFLMPHHHNPLLTSG